MSENFLKRSQSLEKLLTDRSSPEDVAWALRYARLKLINLLRYETHDQQLISVYEILYDLELIVLNQPE